MTRVRSASTALAAGVLLLAGCGGDDGDEVSTDVTPSSTTTEPADTTVPTDALTVVEAVELTDGTEVTVEGYVFQPDEGATVMCDLLGESFPPTCVGAQLVTNGLDVQSLPGIQTTAPGDLVAPATWTTAPVRVTGTLADGALQISS